MRANWLPIRVTNEDGGDKVQSFQKTADMRIWKSWWSLKSLTGKAKKQVKKYFQLTDDEKSIG